jgi:predicted N-acetyltransferase YhbS
MAARAQEVMVRRATPQDAAVCGEICFRAFNTINRAHSFPCDFPGPQRAIDLLSATFSHPGFYCVVAEAGGTVIGSNCLDERSSIFGIGPITVDPEAQNRRVGRRLMEAVLDRTSEKGAPGVRLVQAAFHNRSLSLYTAVGFAVREPLSCMQGKTRQRQVEGCTVRPATVADLDACNALSLRVHGFHRGGELRDAIGHGSAVVVEREGRLTAYSSALAFFGHSTAETNTDLQAMIASVDSFGGSGILIPARNTALFQWCLANGLRIVQPMTLMSMGLYNDPQGAWLPSILY